MSEKVLRRSESNSSIFCLIEFLLRSDPSSGAFDEYDNFFFLPLEDFFSGVLVELVECNFFRVLNCLEDFDLLFD